MDINLNLLGDFGMSIENFSYDKFYNSCLEMVKKIINSNDKDVDLYFEIYKMYQNGDYKYMDIFVSICLKYQVDLIMDRIAKRNFDKKDSFIPTLNGIGDKAHDLDVCIFDENGIYGSVGMFLNSISFEEIRKVIYDKVGLEYTSHDDLVKILNDDEISYEEKAMLLHKNGYDFNNKTFLIDIQMDSLDNLEEAYCLCKNKFFGRKRGD